MKNLFEIWLWASNFLHPPPNVRGRQGQLKYLWVEKWKCLWISKWLSFLQMENHIFLHISRLDGHLKNASSSMSSNETHDWASRFSASINSIPNFTKATFPWLCQFPLGRGDESRNDTIRFIKNYAKFYIFRDFWIVSELENTFAFRWKIVVCRSIMLFNIVLQAACIQLLPTPDTTIIYRRNFQAYRKFNILFAGLEQLAAAISEYFGKTRTLKYHKTETFLLE